MEFLDKTYWLVNNISSFCLPQSTDVFELNFFLSVKTFCLQSKPKQEIKKTISGYQKSKPENADSSGK